MVTFGNESGCEGIGVLVGRDVEDWSESVCESIEGGNGFVLEEVLREDC